MKKSSLVVAMPALIFSGLLLSGCGMFRSHKAWDQAKQESPLEIPPGLDTPSATEALVIPPPGANQPNANGATAAVNGSAGVIVDGFVFSDTVENTYEKVGQVLGQGDIGQVGAHDDAAHSYAITVTAAPLGGEKRGFFGRMFHSSKSKEQGTGGPGATPHEIQVTVGPSGQSASEVRAQGNPAGVAKVVDALKARLNAK
jgi:hypothetical protein